MTPARQAALLLCPTRCGALHCGGLLFAVQYKRIPINTLLLRLYLDKSTKSKTLY
jgi:hypothetical protein